MRDASTPRVAISASSSRDMRGIRICTSARSTERCSRISSPTSSATPTITTVAGATRSESVLIVSANSARSFPAAPPSRSNSSKMTAIEACCPIVPRVRCTACGVTAAEPSMLAAGVLVSLSVEPKPIECELWLTAISDRALRQTLE